MARSFVKYKTRRPASELGEQTVHLAFKYSPQLLDVEDDRTLLPSILHPPTLTQMTDMKIMKNQTTSYYYKDDCKNNDGMMILTGYAL